MESRAKLLGHPVHQMLIVFPLGLLAMAVVFDLVALARAEGYWSEIAYWMIAPGIVISAEALYEHAAKLPRIDIQRPAKVIRPRLPSAIANGCLSFCRHS